MLKISERAGMLHWTQPSAPRMEYELRSRGELVATLGLCRRFGSLATAESADGSFTFRRTGFWQNRATIRERGGETDLAVFRNNPWAAGGELLVACGRRYKATTNFWLTWFEFCTEEEKSLVSFCYNGLCRRSAQVDVAAAARGLADLPLLVLFGWYLMVMLDRDAGAVAVSA